MNPKSRLVYWGIVAEPEVAQPPTSSPLAAVPPPHGQPVEEPSYADAEEGGDEYFDEGASRNEARDDLQCRYAAVETWRIGSDHMHSRLATENGYLITLYPTKQQPR